MDQQQMDAVTKRVIILTKHVAHQVVQTNIVVLAEPIQFQTDAAEDVPVANLVVIPVHQTGALFTRLAMVTVAKMEVLILVMSVVVALDVIHHPHQVVVLALRDMNGRIRIPMLGDILAGDSLKMYTLLILMNIV